MTVELHPAAVAGTIAAPASKSYAQRAVAAALLAKGRSILTGIDLSNDTRAALNVAAALGATVQKGGRDDTYIINGGLAPRSHHINIGESGLSARLFTPIAALCDTEITVAGEGSILMRPITMMEAPLRELGVEVRSAGGRLPIIVRGPMRGGVVHADGELSSQFITGLLMAAPLAAADTFIRVTSLNSRPYIDMTLEVMRRFGVEADNRNYVEFFVAGGQSYTPAEYMVEGDWSGASTLLVAGATRGNVTITNLNPASAQADAAILEALRRAGAVIEVFDRAGESCGMATSSDETAQVAGVTVRRSKLHAFEFDATQCPDLFPALAALAVGCEGVTTLTGTNRLTHKESDRAQTLREEFAKLGANIDISTPNIMKITGGHIHGAQVDSHNDHRIAMALAVAALGAVGTTTITGAGAVNKSYPGFWEAVASITI